MTKITFGLESCSAVRSDPGEKAPASVAAATKTYCFEFMYPWIPKFGAQSGASVAFRSQSYAVQNALPIRCIASRDIHLSDVVDRFSFVCLAEQKSARCLTRRGESQWNSVTVRCAMLSRVLVTVSPPMMVRQTVVELAMQLARFRVANVLSAFL